uniref:Rab-GAP TBC domain-containing protein n=1 Tax=Nelumbo nucifera TaxID=4432 RepID=A0A822Y1K5_NELNU|nr:TPA_asm: hypothetical protein HUJ06_026643 [Nelumbo nucifera]
MSLDEEDKQWTCVKAGTVNLQLISSIVRDIREPCLHSPTKINKMLKPEKWQATFDSNGRVLGFQKVLKSIVLGGVDPSIRAEVWEFLLGCYSLGSTADYRRRLRMARRLKSPHFPLSVHSVVLLSTELSNENALLLTKTKKKKKRERERERNAVPPSSYEQLYCCNKNF